MAFRPPPKILQRVLRFRSLKHHDDGRLTLWGIPAYLWPLYSLVFLHRLIEEKHGREHCAGLFYALGKFQSAQTFEMISRRFGYAKSIHDKSSLLKFNTGQSEMAGLGSAEWKVINFRKNMFVIRLNSSFAREYMRFFGAQKGTVDHFFRGAVAAYVNEITGRKDMFCIETRCIAKGHGECEFLVKESFTKKELDGQGIDDLPTDIKKLGSRIEPYISLAADQDSK